MEGEMTFFSSFLNVKVVKCRDRGSENDFLVNFVFCLAELSFTERLDFDYTCPGIINTYY